MSGEIAFLAGDQGDKLVRTLRRFVEASPANAYAVIGGAAVAVRVGSMHRATSDVDSVVTYEAIDDAVRILTASDDTTLETTPSETRRVLIDGTKLELIPVVSPLPTDATDGMSDKDILFIRGHAWAIESATIAQVCSTTVAEPVSARVAIPAALLAMKLHAYLDRPATSANRKQPGDAADIYRLLLHNGPAIIEGMPNMPADLRRAFADLGHEALVVDAARVASRARQSDSNVGDLAGPVIAALALPVIDAA